MPKMARMVGRMQERMRANFHDFIYAISKAETNAAREETTTAIYG